MEKYVITEFNRRRLMRGEKYCYRANVFVNDVFQEWIWLCEKDIKEILKDKNCELVKEYLNDSKTN